MLCRTMRLLAVPLSALSLLVASAAASGATLRGVVVHHNARAHSFVIAGRGGALSAIHARHAPALGRRATVVVRRLRNGTWSAQRVTTGGAMRRVRIRGAVTSVDRRHGLFVVSARGVSLLVRAHRSRAHLARSSSDSLPNVGEIVTVDGTIAGNGVDESGLQSDGQSSTALDLEGTVMAIDTTARTLTISADDSDTSNGSLTVDVPASFDMSLFAVGQEVELIVSLNPDGTYTLEQSSDDSNTQTAGNPADNQGNGNGDQQPSAEQVCTGQQNDPNFPNTHNGLTFTAFWETNPNEPNDAFGRCVDAMAHGTASSPSPELQCHTEHSDPNFPASHNGESFAQFYNPEEPSNLNDAYGRCIDAKSQQSSG